MRLTLFFLATLLCNFSWVADLSGRSVAQTDKPTIKIGAALPLSGNNAYLGEKSRQGMQLRIKELPMDSKFEYQVIYEDDEMVPAKINLANRKLLNFDKVDVIISLWGFGYSIAMPVVKNCGRDVVHMSLDSWAESSGYAYDFVLCASCKDYAQKVAETLKTMKVRTIVFWGSATTDERRYCQFLKEALAKDNIKLLDESYTNYDTRDFRTYILKIRDLNPDAFVMTTVQPATEIALRQMREINYRPILVGGSANFLDVTDKKLVEGAYYVLTPPAPAWFVEKFKKAYSQEPQYPAANGYDTMGTLISACEKLPAGAKPTGAQIAEKLRQTKDYPGALGPTSYQAPNKLPSPVVCYKIENGTPRVISLEEISNSTQK